MASAEEQKRSRRSRGVVFAIVLEDGSPLRFDDGLPLQLEPLQLANA